MNIPPVAPIPNFRAGERHENAPKPRRGSRGKHDRPVSARRTLTESLPSAGYDASNGEDGSDLGHLTDQTV